jgi:hypothetical protein
VVNTKPSAKKKLELCWYGGESKQQQLGGVGSSRRGFICGSEGFVSRVSRREQAEGFVSKQASKQKGLFQAQPSKQKGLF